MALLGLVRRLLYTFLMMNEKTAVVAPAALAQDARLRIFRALIGVADQGLRPSELSLALGIPPSTSVS